mmetsp:Transcript_4603/g.9709  ORF Transcript_4603/g.9709 Transcript_4603/m.9709 type:complete len:454 (+) Transcript_4603:270-1631(+)|eukprot:CAMPEP_0194333738 /NCGR_PEP_ID=MMETSP0171-20130528/63822_1 /TAXON_ID=218684 /ORGANISM="Corethron pennatum, Strain L29A3" /LENGTH=453 /DNA_ID=CAMNT_0039096099 /DNA_START=158 /DNA_END=1519 /DNA_ORIENTATION=-
MNLLNDDRNVRENSRSSAIADHNADLTGHTDGGSVSDHSGEPISDEEQLLTEVNQYYEKVSQNVEDENYNNDDREYNGIFEGPEKTLEVCFRYIEGYEPTDVALSNKGGLRHLERSTLDKICSKARVTILSSVSNDYLDSYVLSESSLFVYPTMITLKTCGTTTLLRCVSILIEYARKLGMELEWVVYSRKNFNFPGDQAFPHQSFYQELAYLNNHRNLSERLNGNGYTLGPVTDDHWFVFVADQTRREVSDYTDRVLNIMMFDIDEIVAQKFYYDNYEKSENETEEENTHRISKEMTKAGGIDTLCPGATIDPRAFEPCGYSMNGILYSSYATMHITPEKGSSYASYETNQQLTSYTPVLNNVIRSFKPKRFIVTLMADDGGIAQIKENPILDHPILPIAADGTALLIYKQKNLASIKVEDDCNCMMANYVLDDAKKPCVNYVKRRGLSMAH